MKESLFQEFEKVSAKEWKQKIQFDLKGKDYNETLVYKSLENISIKPFYTKEDVKNTPKTPSPKNWEICEKFYVDNAKICNSLAKKALEKGSESLWFVIPNKKIEIQTLFKHINLEKTPVFLQFEEIPSTFLNRLRNYIQNKKTKISLQIDPIGNLARSGNWYTNLEEDFESTEKIFSKKEDFNAVLSIDSNLYQNAGANCIQQIAYSLAHVNEYFQQFKKLLKNHQFQIIIGIGSNYFFEIAKIKALRWVFASLAKEYKLMDTCHILAVPSKRNKTLYDYNVNLLRTTTESMSAILGGANTIYNLPYDSIYHKNNEFGDRMARNQLLILKHESHFDKVSNAAQGTYYIESLTRQMAEKALALFKEIEAGGGFITQLKSGTIQNKIKESAEKEQNAFNTGKLSLIGSNSYLNPEDKMQGELEIFPFLKKNPRKTLIQPVLERRLSETLEEERLKEENTGTPSK